MNIYKTIVCPVCGHTDCQPIYRLSGLPVHSVRLALTAPEAMSMAPGDIELYHCKRCSMVWNQAFDARMMHYDASYEETQGFSSTFQVYHQWLAEYLVERYSLSRKKVLEIGCGKGEFLELLAAQGIGYGYGFDPSFDPSRISGHENLAFYREFFPPGTSSPNPVPVADFYVCKMTLEHIYQPRRFLEKMRATIGEGGAKIAIQVPALERIVDECAYWDIYYEHCNYFNTYSLTSLLELSGFSVIEATTIFNGQYLNVVAVAETVERTYNNSLNAEIERFSRELGKHLSAWRDVLITAAKEEKLLIWGAASKAVALLNALPELQTGTQLVDINPHKQGSYLPSTALKIKAPDDLRNQDYDLILVANPVYLEEISNELGRMNITGRVVALGALPTG